MIKAPPVAKMVVYDLKVVRSRMLLQFIRHNTILHCHIESFARVKTIFRYFHKNVVRIFQNIEKSNSEKCPDVYVCVRLDVYVGMNAFRLAITRQCLDQST